MGELKMNNKEIDSLVAEKIMGLQKSPYGEYLIDGVKVFSPSEDLEDAMRVLARFDSWQITNGGTGRFKEGKYRTIVDANHFVHYEDSLPMSICVAALIAKKEMDRPQFYKFNQ